jgi:hypothetical protein
MDASMAALSECCQTAPIARADIKRSLDLYYGRYDRIGMDMSLDGDEAIEGFHAFKERRPPAWVPEGLRREGRL